MLSLTRKEGQVIYVGDDLTITVVRIERNKVRLAFDLPREVPINRAELCEDGTRLRKAPATS